MSPITQSDGLSKKGEDLRFKALSERARCRIYSVWGVPAVIAGGEAKLDIEGPTFCRLQTSRLRNIPMP